jgi:UDP-N-acetylglucosamine 3-dehydrogenase
VGASRDQVYSSLKMSSALSRPETSHPSPPRSEPEPHRTGAVGERPFLPSVAVVGAGNMGRHHARLLSQNRNVGDVVICDPDPRRRSALQLDYPVETVADLDALLERRPLPSAAVVAVPTHLHHPIGSRLLSTGIPCLIEKPIAASLEEADDLERMARERGVTLAVGHVERFNPAVRELKRLIDGDVIGEAKLLIARRAGPGPLPSKDRDSDVIIDIGIHDIDVLMYLLGGVPKSVFAAGGRSELSPVVVDYAAITLDFGGVVAQIQVDWVSPCKVRRLDVVGTGGMATLEYITQDLSLYMPAGAPRADDFSQLVMAARANPSGQRVEVKPSEPLAVELDGFIEKVATGLGQVVTATEARAALAVAVAASEQLSL